MPSSPPNPTSPPPRLTGPIFEAIHGALHGRFEYDRFRTGALSRAGFANFLDHSANDLIAGGVPPNDVHFAKRFPRSHENFVHDALAALVDRGLLPHTRYDPKHAAEARHAAARYDHAGYATYIYPEEGMLLHAIAEIVQPRRVVFLGSYYGYWACWALPEIVRAGGTAVLVDPDPLVQAVARGNLVAASIAQHVELVVDTGQAYLSRTADLFDLVVLDAEGRRDDPDPSSRGKRVYQPLLAHVLPRMTADALLVCHNILLSDHSGTPFLRGIVARNRDELRTFIDLVGREIDGFTELASTEGVGVGRRRRQRVRGT